MSETGFTPGPWAFFFPAGSPDGFRIAAVDRDVTAHIAYVRGLDDNMGSWRANARLIAAAPDLYEALEELLSCCEAVNNGRVVVDPHGMESARAALAKVSATPK